MKKLILKTASITLGATIVVLVAVFGLMSLWAPAVMMDLTASLGLDAISGDYAYQEYERSGKLEYLARSFIVSAHTGNDRKAMNRFNELREDEEKFSSFCDEQKDIVLTEKDSLSYRSYLYAQGVCVMYRTSNQDDWSKICDLAVENTEPSFPVGNPVVALATEALSNEDSKFCAILLKSFANGNWDTEQVDFQYIMKFLNELTGGMSQ